MQISTEQRGKVLVVIPKGKRLEAGTSTNFKSAMVDCINNGATLIVLDLSLVDFIDSSGLGSIVSVLKTLGEDGEMVLCGINKTVMSLFRLTRLDRIFKIFSTVDDAAASFLKA